MIQDTLNCSFILHGNMFLKGLSDVIDANLHEVDPHKCHLSPSIG